MPRLSLPGWLIPLLGLLGACDRAQAPSTAGPAGPAGSIGPAWSAGPAVSAPAASSSAPLAPAPLHLQGQPPYPETDTGRALLSCSLAHLRERPGSTMYAASCGGSEVLLLTSTADNPRRALPQVATYRLARALGLGVVPATTLRSFPLARLLDAVETEGLRRRLGEEVALRPDGEVEVAISEDPGPTRLRGARWSLEQALWARLAEATTPIPPEHVAAVRGYMTLRVIDYLTANVFRKSVEQRPSGALVLVDNRDGFLEHPEPLAVDQILAEIKRFSRFPRGLVQALDALNEHRLEEALQSGPFDDWLVHRRPRRELLIRARMLASLVRVRREARGDEVLLDD